MKALLSFAAGWATAVVVLFIAAAFGIEPSGAEVAVVTLAILAAVVVSAFTKRALR